MTNPKDIIGLVQIHKKQIESGIGAEALGLRMIRDFPAIADALLIAVEALEKSSKQFGVEAMMTTADALLRIHSLSPSER